jgi:hypothetical protein
MYTFRIAVVEMRAHDAKRQVLLHAPRRLMIAPAAVGCAGEATLMLKPNDQGGERELTLDPELSKVMIEMPVLQDIPVTWPHPPETGMDDSQPVRRRRDEAFDEFDHDLPIALPTETWSVERARRRLNLPFRPRQAVDGQVSQDRATNSPGRRTFDLPLA